MPSRSRPPTPGGLGRRIRRRTQELAAALAVLREAVPRERRDPAYRQAVTLAERNIADLEELSRELPGLVNSMRQQEAVTDSASAQAPAAEEPEDDEMRGAGEIAQR